MRLCILCHSAFLSDKIQNKSVICVILKPSIGKTSTWCLSSPVDLLFELIKWHLQFKKMNMAQIPFQ